MTATIDRLLDAAESAMRLRGYHAVSFRDLAEELGIKSASVHYHFRQKEELGLALVERYSSRFFADVEARARNATTPGERIAAFCSAYEGALKSADKTCLCGLLGAEISGLPERLASAVADFFKDNLKWVADALPGNLTAQQRGAQAAHIVASLQGAMMLATSLKDQTILEAAAAALIAEVAETGSGPSHG